MSAAVKNKKLKPQRQYISIIYFLLSGRLEDLQPHVQTYMTSVVPHISSSLSPYSFLGKNTRSCWSLSPHCWKISLQGTNFPCL